MPIKKYKIIFSLCLILSSEISIAADNSICIHPIIRSRVLLFIRDIHGMNYREWDNSVTEQTLKRLLNPARLMVVCESSSTRTESKFCRTVVGGEAKTVYHRDGQQPSIVLEFADRSGNKIQIEKSDYLLLEGTGWNQIRPFPHKKIDNLKIEDLKIGNEEQFYSLKESAIEFEGLCGKYLVGDYELSSMTGGSGIGVTKYWIGDAGFTDSRELAWQAIRVITLGAPRLKSKGVRGDF